MERPVILTGVRANAELTLGNYLGAIKQVVQLQRQYSSDYQINMFVPDLHSFTTPIDHGNLYQNTLDNLKVYVASGLVVDQPHTYTYRQSRIPAHSELTWILDCFVYYGELKRMIQFKEKSSKEGKVSVGLFNYPVLMAADILLYDAKYIPVGEDQRQHLELARDIATRFNNQFRKSIFTIPEDWNHQLKFTGLDNGLKIRSLKHPEIKMSKSISDPSGTILLNDSPELATKKILAATTDSIGSINFDYANQPGISNLIQIFAQLSNLDLSTAIAKWSSKTNYSELKRATATLVGDFLSDLQTKIKSINEIELLDQLKASEKSMREVSNAKLINVQKAVGLRQQ